MDGMWREGNPSWTGTGTSDLMRKQYTLQPREYNKNGKRKRQKDRIIGSVANSHC
jgi:hypothetical protein